MTEEIKLMQHSKASGCGCKIPPEVLKNILSGNLNANFPGLIVGNENNEDAAVIEFDNENLILHTLDFFTPLVNDPYDFGRIAAANAISDIYAMGGKPISALAILGWPISILSTEPLKQIMSGAEAICREAKIPLCGGHSIESSEPIFGLSVNGICQKQFLKRNNTIKEGDSLFLSKPLGSGIFSAALKRDLLKDDDYKTLIKYCTKLNSIGFELGKYEFVHAMTDVTGFGFLGHLKEMLSEKKFSAEIRLAAVPVMENIDFYTKQFINPNLTTTNYNSVIKDCDGLNGLEFLYLCDPQTNGGLLCSVDSKKEKEFQKICAQHSFHLEPIGKIIPLQEKMIYIR